MELPKNANWPECGALMTIKPLPSGMHLIEVFEILYKTYLTRQLQLQQMGTFYCQLVQDEFISRENKEQGSPFYKDTVVIVSVD